MFNLKNKKKGFTIVELVIVIAVVAILSAVLIPTFVSLVKKANLASDTALVKNLNTVITADTQVNGKHKTMYDALEVTKESGLDVSKLNAKVAKNEILWDSANDVFCYLDDGEIKYVPNMKLDVKADDVKDHQYYVIRDVKSQNDISTKYSTYLRSSTLATLSTSKSLDVGDVTTVTEINYSNSGAKQEVVIRTNGGTLNIDAEKDTVVHYGNANVIDVSAVAINSYHEFGKVAFLKVAKGRVVVENKAYVEVVYKTSATAVVEKNSSATINNAFADSSANASNTSSSLQFTTTEKTEDALKTESKKELEYYVKAEEGYVAKAGGVYYKTIAEAMKKANLVYVTADTAEDVTLSANKVLVVERGTYTGNVSGVTSEVEVTCDLDVYVGSYNAVMANYTSFSPVTKEVTVKLLRDLNLATKQTIKSGANLVFDLNGKTINSNYNTSLGSLFVVSGNFTLKSSVEGAKVNLLTKAGLLEVASSATDKVVNISNIEVTRTVESGYYAILCRGTVNVEDSKFTVKNTSTYAVLVQENGKFNAIDSTFDIKIALTNGNMNASSTPFQTQNNSSVSFVGTTLNVECLNKDVFSINGDLTLGEGTVVNVNTKSAGLVTSNYREADVVVDGAEINFVEFAHNGGEFIKLLTNNTLTITDSELTLILNEDNTFGLPKFVKGSTNVTISNLTTDIKGLTSGATYTIDPETAVWSKN